MRYIKSWLLLSIFLLLTSCSNKIELKPEGYYLHEATIGKPYRQVVYLRGNAKVTYIDMGTWPEDSTGLTWRFSKADSSYWDENTKQGDAIEITGIPNDNPQKEIKIVFRGSCLGTMFPGEDLYKEYMIKLVSATSVKR